MRVGDSDKDVAIQACERAGYLAKDRGLFTLCKPGVGERAMVSGAEWDTGRVV